ncbi:hypothetical protein GJAV_G00220710 [Gymnothorax javanicus]|nr:hypothetical protein GJAV_G00220710 [Gymnothorax javanicus]
MSPSDIESLQPRASSGGRCLHTFLVTSVITLFVLLFGVTAIAALFIWQIRTELSTLGESTHEATNPQRLQGAPEYKVQNFAFLRAKSGHLKNITMPLKKGSLNTVGSAYEFDSVQSIVQPHKEGSYLLYLDLVLRCGGSNSDSCGPIDVTVRIKDETDRSLLECQVSAKLGRVEKCWKVVQLKPEHRLLAQMEARGDSRNWELDTEQSGMGMFLVDG